MLNGLDLFSGVGGNSLALGEWINTVAYCEADRHAQAVLLSRMREGFLPSRPIWDNVSTLRGQDLPSIDIIIAGFPCQDISVAGRGEGIKGKRSGLFFEIVRLAKEIKPAFLFLENVPAIRKRGLDVVIQEFTTLGYDARWTMLSAKEIGANHKRERWFCLLSNPELVKLRIEQGWSSGKDRERATKFREYGEKESMARLPNPNGERLEGQRKESSGVKQKLKDIGDHSWWTTEPNVGRVAHGTPFRVDRLKRTGNGVVPLQAREAFKELIGIKKENI